MPTHVSEALRARVAAADLQRCAYCQTGEAITGLPLTIEHIWKFACSLIERLTPLGHATVDHRSGQAKANLMDAMRTCQLH